MKSFENKIMGSIMGLAVGDALGAPVEFKARGSFPYITHYQDGGEFNLKAGQWTDDTSLMLCLLSSFVEKKTFDLDDQMIRFLKWWKQGYMSSTGECFDIGNTTKASLSRFEQTKLPLSGETSDKASNGALMRLAPVPLFYHFDLSLSLHQTALQCQSTHAPADCIESAQLLSYVLTSLLNGESKESVLSFKNYPLLVSENFLSIVRGNIFKLCKEQINAEGMAYNTLEAALYAFYHFDNFYDGLLFVVNLGDDSDTVGAVYGQIAGCAYGYNNIPTFLLEGLFQREKIELLAREFVGLIEGIKHD